MSDGPLPRYRQLVRSGEIQADPAQRAAVEKLQLLAMRLGDYDPGRGKQVALGWFGFGRKAAKADHALTGLYLYGGVGRGKSMLMDLFFAAAPVRPKRRVHFHAFMQEAQAGLHAARESNVEDPIRSVAEEIAEDAVLLCFDEFHVTDVADAMILGRLFEALFARGVVVVATSNRPPDELYKDGLNRQVFLPFIGMLKERLDLLELDSPRDFRHDLAGGSPSYFTPLGAAADAAMDAAWARETNGEPGAPLTLSVHGRRIALEQATEDTARASFEALCERTLGPSDYLALAARFRTVFIDGIPRLSWAQNNEAHRLVTLIDALYEARVRLYVSAEAPPGQLYTEGKGAFEFARTASRLIEMQSAAWMARTRGPMPAAGR
ncbi:MAG TPA: cell division protein ZapE [Thermohalobaculum sp.]|nr:cell division protein ZapE [Thermohalobaculum sp.]